MSRNKEKNPEYWINMGYSLTTEGKDEQAKKYYKKALELDPKNLTALVNLAKGVKVKDLEDSKKHLLQAIEINLRKGGTTHPFMTLKLLTNGYYDYSTGLFLTQQNQPKYYLATDNLQKPQYRGLLPNDLMDIIAQHRLHFDSSNRTGSVFHLMGALSEFGKLGLTSIGNSLAEAEMIYRHVEEVLDQETQSMLNSEIQFQPSTLPINW